MPLTQKTIGSIYYVVGIVMLLLVAQHFFVWVVLTLLGWKLMNTGMRLRGQMPLAYYVQRFCMNIFFR
jgi:hypothetical protein